MRNLGRNHAVFLSAVLPVSMPSFAQPTNHETSSVPFVGCPSDGQAGPQDAPKGADKTTTIDSATAERLAFYKAEFGPGVFGPRGWYCVGLEGSSGSTVYLTPAPLNARDLLFS